MAPPSRYWADLTTTDFAATDVGGWIAVLPIAATEQHGPHLPTGTDTMIGEGLMREAVAAMPDALPAVILPTLAVGKSDEHLAFPGTLTLSAATLTDVVVQIGRSVARTGIRKLVVVSSHGGNSEAMGIAGRELRLARGMLVVATSWARLGQPDGLFDMSELRHGIHGGDVETSLMLHLAADVVRMNEAADFVPASIAMETEFEVLRGTGPTGFAWAMEDLNPAGVCGDAAAATATKGKASAAHAAARFVALIKDVHRFDVDRLSRD